MMKSHEQQEPFYFLLISKFFIAIAVILFLLLTGCERLPNTTEHSVSAQWDSGSATLTVTGGSTPGSETVQIHDASDGKLLGKANVNDDGSWSASSTTPACDVHVELAALTLTAAVKDAPGNCTTNSSTGIGGRVIGRNEIPVDVLVVDNPEPLANIPNAVILNPPQNMTINVGQIVDFQGAVTGDNITAPFSFYWNFGGAAPNALIQNPGAIRFDSPGTYFIQLSATDSQGIPDPTPASRTIIVTNGNTSAALAPVPQIVSPAVNNGSIGINVGESLQFSGTASDSLGSSAFLYEWDFSGIYPTQFGATTNFIPFNRAGTYLVSLYATNEQGLRSPTPATVSVLVSANNGGNQAPSGSITFPANDVAINAGESLTFFASGRDPDNNTPLEYSWDFDDVAREIENSKDNSAGPITFDKPGIYTIKMTVKDAKGLEDPNPALRTVTVMDNVGVLSHGIASPPADVTIAPGQSVFFSAQSSNNNGSSLFFWDFGGAAANSTLQTPGDVTFSSPGQFVVSLYIADATGAISGSPDTRTITVSAAGDIDADIISPEDNSTVPLGSAINLIGMVRNANGFNNVRYEWEIKRRGSNDTVFTSNQESPGQYVFTQAGDYRIKFSVRANDPLGNQRVSSRTRNRITVVDTGAGAGGIPPIGSPNPFTNNSGILLPASDMVIYAGNEVDFEANRINGANVDYRWDFGGAQSPSNRRDPSPVRFNTPGTFFITLQVTGTNNGLPINIFDQRTITVLQSNNAFPPTSPVATSGISSPAGDVVINAGDSVDFEANRINGANVNYQWDFGGVRSPSSRRNPSRVTFNTPGTYFVSLQVTGTANGLPINIFDQRVITVLQQFGGLPPANPSPFPPPTNPIAANSGILLPATDMVINLGNEVNFEANRINGNNVNYFWDFSGASSPSTRRNPSPVRFNTPGTFFVTLQVTGDNNGFPINIFDQRVITVLQQSLPFPPAPSPFPPAPSPFPPGANPLVGNAILLPATDTVINVGNEVDFEANRINGNNVNYYWDFGTLQSPSTQRNPSPVRFNTPGTFVVRLQVTGDNNGFPINYSEQRIITVLPQASSFPPNSPFPPGGNNPFPSAPIAASGPEGYITQPASQFVSVRVGQPVNFAGTGFDPQGTGPLSFQWSFGGARRNIQTQNPGSISFDRVGTYVVTLLVQNALGQFDTTPASVLVSVTP